MKALFASPVLLLALAAACVATAEDAAAAPGTHLAGRTAVAFGGPRIHVGVGVAVPFGHGHGHHRQRAVRYREVVEVVGGYYETRTEEVRVPGRRIGYDVHGHPIYTRDRIELREVRVWVPRREIVRRVRVRGPVYHHHHHHRGPHGYVTVGGRVRVR